MKKEALKELKMYEEFTGAEVNKEGILKTFDIFSKQGHTGFTASYALGFLYALVEDYDKTITILMDTLKDDEDGSQRMINSHILDIYKYFEMVKLDKKEMKLALDLLDFKPLAPLLGTDDEWKDLSDTGLFDGEIKLYSNNRCSGVYKSVFANGIEIAYISNKIYSEDGGMTFFSTNKFPKEQISFPYTVPTEKEKVYLYEYDENKPPIILTDKDTIKKLQDSRKNKIDSETEVE